MFGLRVSDTAIATVAAAAASGTCTADASEGNVELITNG
jgi:hypothetical protein